MADLSHYIDQLHEQTEPLLEQGQAEEALTILNDALEEKSGNPLAIAAILDLRGTLYYQCDHIDYAIQDFTNGLAALDETSVNHELAGSLHASLGAAHHALNDIAETIKHWQKAMQHYQSNDPPLHIDTATIANNLGFLYKQSDDMDSAENSFLRALQILHGELGKYDAFTATVFCNWAASISIQASTTKPWRCTKPH